MAPNNHDLVSADKFMIIERFVATIRNNQSNWDYMYTYNSYKSEHYLSALTGHSRLYGPVASG